MWAVSSCAGVPSGPSPTPSTGFTFPYPGFYDVPRLGTEEVLGTGCGGNGSLGDTIPDGFWFGWVEALGPTSLEFDVACIYIGNTAAQLEQEWLNDPAQQNDDPSPYFGGGWWLVNNNERTRTVPLAPGFVVAGANNSDPVAPNPNWPAVPGYDYACVPPVDPAIQPPYAIAGSYNYTGSWLYIAGGQAQYALLGMSTRLSARRGADLPPWNPPSGVLRTARQSPGRPPRRGTCLWPRPTRRWKRNLEPSTAEGFGCSAAVRRPRRDEALDGEHRGEGDAEQRVREQHRHQREHADVERPRHRHPGVPKPPAEEDHRRAELDDEREPHADPEQPRVTDHVLGDR